MNKVERCVVCEEGDAFLFTYSDTFVEPRTKTETVVGGLQAYECCECRSEYISPELMEKNSERIREAFTRVRNITNVLWRSEQ